MAYLRGLARDYRIILVTREKAEDWANTTAVADARAECAALGIEWRPRPFRPRPRFLGPARDIISMTFEALRAVRTEAVALVHARSYIPAIVSWVVWRVTGTPFIFDTRALWPEELITAGRVRRGSLPHRAILWAEQVCLRDAAVVVSLTHAAVDYLEMLEPELRDRGRVEVIPTCTDLSRFTPAVGPRSKTRVYACIGSVLTGWFRADWLAAWFAGVAEEDPTATFEIVSRDDPAEVRVMVDPGGRLGKRLSVYSRPPRDMPGTVRAHAVSAMFYAGGQTSELGRSPTRLGEVLGCGIPVVANRGVGDVASILNEHRVGVVLEHSDADNVRQALQDLKALLEDPDLSARCRAASVQLFSLETGTEAYRRLYRRLLNGKASS
ncbi:glycosyltransferase [Altererythrobacter sp. B11]|uniref:glycosyltransferase n=1 Tax=Altererythrobacter sp. B11 TaxID=2060312 RepID=UPI001E3FC9A2|nr:glycosyltransferase [Altererythrobacter sp. B11]